jgi:hypothetical protein
MVQEDSPHSLHVPFFEELRAIGFGEHGNVHHFEIGTLFWSLTRLFGCYERVLSVLSLPRAERPFLEADLEHFIVRFRIVLNDVAFVLRQLLPIDARGLKGPKGGTHPRNREMSVFVLSEFFLKFCEAHPEFALAFQEADAWMTRLKNDRDNVVHYKAKVVIFESPEPSFALLNAAGTERTEPTPEGGSKLLLEPVGEFVNTQMLALHYFMNGALANSVRAHALRGGLKMMQVGQNHRITCIGIQRFRNVNAIGN